MTSIDNDSPPKLETPEIASISSSPRGSGFITSPNYYFLPRDLHRCAMRCVPLNRPHAHPAAPERLELSFLCQAIPICVSGLDHDRQGGHHSNSTKSMG